MNTRQRWTSALAGLAMLVPSATAPDAVDLDARIEQVQVDYDLQAETTRQGRSTTFTLNNGISAVYTPGTKGDAVLIHPYLNTPQVWEGVVKELQEQGYGTLVVDYTDLDLTGLLKQRPKRFDAREMFIHKGNRFMRKMRGAAAFAKAGKALFTDVKIPEKWHEPSMRYFAHSVRELVKASNANPTLIAGRSMGGMVALEYLKQFPNNIQTALLFNTSNVNPIDNVRFDFGNINIPMNLGSVTYKGKKIPLLKMGVRYHVDHHTEPGWNTWKWIVDNKLPTHPEYTRTQMFIDSCKEFLKAPRGEKIRRAFSRHPIKEGYKGRTFPKENLQGALDGVKAVSSHHAWAGLKAISEWEGVDLDTLLQNMLVVWSTNDRLMHPSVSKRMAEHPKATGIRTNTAHNHYADAARMVRDYLRQK